MLSSNTQPVYIRKTVEEHLKNDHKMINSFEGKVSNYHGFILGFCGKIYFGFYKINDFQHKQYTVFYTKESLVAHYPDVLKPIKESFWRRDAPTLDYSDLNGQQRYGYGVPSNIQGFEKYFSPTCPVFVIYNENRDRDTYLIRNPLLKKYEVFKLFPIAQMFQEIEMYLGGLAVNEDKIPPVSDEDMIKAKGFDKFSFRKDPTKKR